MLQLLTQTHAEWFELNSDEIQNEWHDYKKKNSKLNKLIILRQITIIYSVWDQYRTASFCTEAWLHLKLKSRIPLFVGKLDHCSIDNYSVTDVQCKIVLNVVIGTPVCVHLINITARSAWPVATLSQQRLEAFIIYIWLLNIVRAYAPQIECEEG